MQVYTSIASSASSPIRTVLYIPGIPWVQPECANLYPIYYLRPSILSLLVVTQIRDHIAGSSSPLPTTVRDLHFYREKISVIFSLVDSRRIVLAHAKRSQQLILFFFTASCKCHLSGQQTAPGEVSIDNK